MDKIVNVEEKKVEALRLISSGFNFGEVCKGLGISYSVFYKWRKLDHRFNSLVEGCRNERELIALDRGLAILAEGSEETILTEEYTELDEDGRPRVIKKRVRKIPPDIGALRMLANKHERVYNEKGDASQIINVRITQRDRSLSFEERIKLLEDDSKGIIEGEVVKEN